MNAEVWEITPRPRPPLEELAGSWALINVEAWTCLIPLQLLRRHPVTYAHLTLGGWITAVLNESEALQAMRACQNSRCGRPD